MTPCRRRTSHPCGSTDDAVTPRRRPHGRQEGTTVKKLGLPSRALTVLASGAVGVAVLSAAPAAFASGPAAASIATGRAVFVQTNDLDHNTVVAYTRQENGH